MGTVPTDDQYDAAAMLAAIEEKLNEARELVRQARARLTLPRRLPRQGGGQ